MSLDVWAGMKVGTFVSIASKSEAPIPRDER